MAKFTIYCDFDGTITQKDMVNIFLEKYADKTWEDIELKWKNGEIGSRECLEKQLELLCPMSDKILNNFVDSIEIDNYFFDFYNFAKNNDIEIVILSDGFDIFIEKILNKHNLEGIKYFANKIEHHNEKLIANFPYTNSSCERRAGTCKCLCAGNNIEYYIGDGFSDVCIAKNTKTLFAKGNLLAYCNENLIKCIKFDNFEDILNYIKLRIPMETTQC